MNALNKFSVMSSLYPNLGKCTMFCGSLNEDDKIEISSIIPFKEGKLPVRAQLIAYVLGSMQVYWCYVFLLPKAVMNDIEKLFKNFLWNNGDNCKGKEKVAWLEVCKPNDQGCNHKDKAIWVDNNGSEKKFTTNIVWKDVRGSSGKVSWFQSNLSMGRGIGMVILGEGECSLASDAMSSFLFLGILWPFLYCGCWLSVVRVPWIGKCSQEGMVLVNNGEQAELSV
ncbi:hypothetical protein Tco_0921240 [Tanacetum coccineum]